MPVEDLAATQLQRFKDANDQNPDAGVLTTSQGIPIGMKTASVSVGPRGPLLLEDSVLIDELSHFDRERIPERVVHAKGAGAFGYFEVTHDITWCSAAKVFSKVGKRTPIAVRFSSVGGESGSADTVRDPRGFAIKFYTDDGNWDLVGNNTPIFFIRDPILFPNFIHTQKRNPVTHLKDPDMFWDFITLRPETMHQVTFMFADRGIPDGHRHMHGFGSHTFKLINKNADFVWVKFHYKTEQGVKNLSVERAGELASSDPDYSIRDLYNAIAAGNFPSWSFEIQVMTDEQARQSPFNPFDVTKIWPQKDYPLQPVGRFVLNRNPENYFAEVEQIAFAPANMPPGISFSPDKMLQGRLFSYPDTHRHRLGPNFQQIPVNCPYSRVQNTQRDASMTVNDNQKGAPNYWPNSFGGPQESPIARKLEPRPQVDGIADRYDIYEQQEDTEQVRVFYEQTLGKEERQRTADNIAGNAKAAQVFLQARVVKNWSTVSQEFGQKIKDSLMRQNTPEKAEALRHALH